MMNKLRFLTLLNHHDCVISLMGGVPHCDNINVPQGLSTASTRRGRFPFSCKCSFAQSQIKTAEPASCANAALFKLWIVTSKHKSKVELADLKSMLTDLSDLEGFSYVSSFKALLHQLKYLNLHRSWYHLCLCLFNPASPPPMVIRVGSLAPHGWAEWYKSAVMKVCLSDGETGFSGDWRAWRAVPPPPLPIRPPGDSVAAQVLAGGQAGGARWVCCTWGRRCGSLTTSAGTWGRQRDDRHMASPSEMKHAEIHASPGRSLQDRDDQMGRLGVA